jgi:hypothetical protein
MKIEDIEGLKPLIDVAIEANLLSETLKRHYIKTISELTGKSEKVISKEINDIHSVVKEDTIKKIKNK